jgi:hypothetical protein
MNRLLILCFILLSSLSFAADRKTGTLPKAFAGWQLQSSETSTNPAKADSVYFDLLKEDGLAEVEIANYAKAGRTLSIKAAKFNDASGAYSAYLFYRAPQMAAEEIGDQAASNNERILFRKGSLLIDAKLDKVTPMSGGELRELASLLPQASGNSANLPTIPNYLPKQGEVENSLRYVSGPVGLARISSPLTPALVDFSTGAEIASADYSTGNGTARLTLISYPTPAVAANRLKNIRAWHPAATPGTSATPALYSKRTGPVVAVLTGSIPESEAKTLLASVNYDADITWNQNTHFDRNSNLGSLLVNIIILIAIITGLAIVAGFAFGGARIVLKRLFPDRVFDRSQDADIIRLDIGK